MQKEEGFSRMEVNKFPYRFSQNKLMSHIKVWIHFVWSTKNRQPLLTDEIRSKVFRHIRENAKEKDILISLMATPITFIV